MSEITFRPKEYDWKAEQLIFDPKLAQQAYWTCSRCGQKAVSSHHSQGTTIFPQHKYGCEPFEIGPRGFYYTFGPSDVRNLKDGDSSNRVITLETLSQFFPDLLKE